MAKTKKEAILYFTRDISLFTAEIFPEMIIQKFKKAFGVGQTDQMLHFNGRAMEVFWLKDDMENLKKKIFSFPLDHKLFSPKHRKIFREQIAELKGLVAKAKKAQGKELKDIVKKVLKVWPEMYPHYRVSNFLPGPWAKDFLAVRGKAGERIVKEFEGDRHIGEGTFEECDVMMREIFENLLTKKGVSPSYAKFLNFKEGSNLIFKNKKPNASVIEKRKSGYVVTGKRVYVGIPLPKALERLGYFYKPLEKVVEQKEFKGQVAYRGGVVRGKVKIVLNYDEVKSFPAGEVLVAIMTAPAYVPAMKRAKAIITDEGGVTCHASIVSRELKIPCVIGTKVATKVLKDGDEVEIDTNKGIVEVIKKYG